MSAHDLLKQIESDSVARLSPALTVLNADCDSAATFLTRSLKLIFEQFDEITFDSLQVLKGEKGRFRKLAGVGGNDEAPNELLAESLDSGEVQTGGKWISDSLNRASTVGSSEVLTASLKNAPSKDQELQFNAIAALLSLHYQLAVVRETNHFRIQRNEEILGITMSWNQADDSKTLLDKIAEASTRLLNSERASIFLWNKAAKELVAYPALGVDGGELRISDDTGIVGQVIQTKETRRVDEDIREEQKEIDRKVDEQLDFQTRSLLCVPMIGAKGELLGAFEMINKIGGNFTDSDEQALHELAAHATIALENSKQLETALTHKKQMADEAAVEVRLIGDSEPIQNLRSTIERVADTDLAILVLGENGTGKEVVSRLIHYYSSRRNEPLVAINCAAISETLLESELFGHEQGAFTDAKEAREGKFELASGGTIFLDEIGDMSLNGQSKLLRVLEEKVVVRVGGSVPIPTDARVVAATNQNLAELVKEKKFREDLYFRLSVVNLEIPPLRDRGDDIILLAESFLEDFCSKARRKTLKFSAEGRKKMIAHTWPGNVRELRNQMERLAYLSQGDTIDPADLVFSLTREEESSAGQIELGHSLADATKHFQVQYIKRQIDAARGNMTEAAKQLGLYRSNLYRKMRQLDMDSPDEDE